MNNRRRDRQHSRVPFGAPVQLWKSRSPSSVRALDISRTGLFLRTEDDILEGSYLTLSIALPDGPRFTALCRVARRDGGRHLLGRPGLGVEFIDIAPNHRARIDDYVERVSERAQLSA